MDHREVLFQQRIAFNRADLCAIPGSEIARSLFQSIWSHVIGRRVDKIACKRYGVGNMLCFSGVDACRHRQTDSFVTALAIAREAIAAHQEGESYQICVVWLIFDMPVAFGEAARQFSGEQLRLTALVVITCAKQSTGNRAVFAGKYQNTTGFPVKIIGLGPSLNIGCQRCLLGLILSDEPDWAAVC